MTSVLVTGGAGFIGSHLVARLTGAGHAVTVLDVLEPQVHGGSAGIRVEGASYVVGSVLDRATVASVLDGAEAVIHLAAQVGVGQSMYDIERYVEHNCTGTAVLLEAIAERKQSIRRLVVASSMSIYGEGQYRCDGCDRLSTTVTRSLDALAAGQWEPVCRHCGAVAEAVGTSEDKVLEPSSVYATTKRDQEELCLVVGRSYGVPSVALRFFNVYGPHQSLANPYTGVAAIFASRLLNGEPPLIFEDGLQSRDFIHVADLSRAVAIAMESDVADVAINVGTGIATSVLDIARLLIKELNVDVEPALVGRFRQGDIRHCFADVSRARELLGFAPEITLENGMRDLVRWIIEDAPRTEDRVAASTEELATRGLIL